MSRRFVGPGIAFLLATAMLSSCASTLTRDELAVEYFNLGTAYYELGDLDRSAEYLSRAIQLDESLARASYNLARVYIQQGRLADAHELLTVLLTEDPTNTTLLSTQGYVAYLTGDAQDAARFYDRAIAENPGDVGLLYNRAVIADEADNIQLAASLLQAARDIEPGNDQVLLRLGAVERSAGNTEGAIDAWLAYLDRVGSDSEIEVLVAELYEEGDYYDRALELLEIVVTRGDAEAAVLSHAQFRKAAILLTAAEESELGIAALQTALAAGYSDEESIQTLVDDDRLIERQAVEGLLRDAGLLPSNDDVPAEDAEPVDGEKTVAEPPSTDDETP